MLFGFFFFSFYLVFITRGREIQKLYRYFTWVFFLLTKCVMHHTQLKYSPRMMWNCMAKLLQLKLPHSFSWVNILGLRVCFVLFCFLLFSVFVFTSCNWSVFLKEAWEIEISFPKLKLKSLHCVFYLDNSIDTYTPAIQGTTGLLVVYALANLFLMESTIKYQPIMATMATKIVYHIIIKFSNCMHLEYVAFSFSLYRLVLFFIHPNS